MSILDEDLVYEFHSFNKHPVPLLHGERTLELKFKFQFLILAVFPEQKDFSHTRSITGGEKKVKWRRVRRSLPLYAKVLGKGFFI
ncbi:hypothetical protein DRQ20_02810, partial [bacterium]